VWDGIVEVVAGLRFFLLGGFLVFVAVGRMQSGVAADNALLREALDALQTILFLPVEIAIYRLLILREATASITWANSPPRMWRMVGWTMALWVLMTLPSYLMKLTSFEAVNVIATIAVGVVAIVLLVRLAILLPAIAVDAPGASPGNVLADTNGRTWLILKTYLIVLLPLLAVVVVAGLISDGLGVPDRLGTFRDSAIEFLATAVIAVAEARLFDWIGDRVKGLPAEPGSAQLPGQPPPAG
jgi:hypothetical protein